MFEPEHVNRLQMLGSPQGTLVGRVRFKEWEELEILGVLGDHPMEEEQEELRQPSRP